MATPAVGLMVMAANPANLQRATSKAKEMGPHDGNAHASGDGISLPHPGESRDVYSWFEITLQDINVPEQAFKASVEIHLWWQDFNLPNVFPAYEKNDFTLNEDSLPFKLSEIFENKTSLDISGGPEFKYYPETGTIYMMMVVDCNFYERMELQRFPLDRQFMNMQFNAYWKTENGDWNWILPEEFPEWVPEEFKEKCSKGYVTRMVSSITEYELLGPWIDFAPRQKEDPISVRIRVNRKPGFYFGNVVLPNFLIVAGCFAAFVIPPTEVADRLSITVTLMLAAVAFRFVVSTMLPKVSYLTIMDYYILVGFVALVLLIFENAIVGISSLEQEIRRDIDYGFALVFGAAWVLIHILALYALINGNFLRLSWEKMDEIDKQADPDADIEYPTKVEASKPSDYWSRYKNMKPSDRSKAVAQQMKEKARDVSRQEPIEEKVEEDAGDTYKKDAKKESKTEQNLATSITLQEKNKDKDESAKDAVVVDMQQ
jgi:hypothetical protein